MPFLERLFHPFDHLVLFQGDLCRRMNTPGTRKVYTNPANDKTESNFFLCSYLLVWF